MVALCGMGGVGKTTMVNKLKKAVVEKTMFSYLVQADIGEKPDLNAIQDSIASYIGMDLKVQAQSARVTKLRQEFEAKSNGGKNKFLVVLDDVWQSINLEDIGLSRWPNQGVNFKVLMASRDQAVCTEMGVEAKSVLKLRPLEDAEAQSLFHQFWEPSDDVDPELHKIGKDIVRKCCGLPIAIKTMACTLRNKRKDTWKYALSRLQHHDINTVAPTVFKTSYDNLQDEVTEATFLLCGLFPEDFHIPTEDLLRYGWGLKLFKGLDTIREARYKFNTCIERLIHTNLLIESDNAGCVKMHDLVRDFVLDMFSKDEHFSMVNHGTKTGWPENGMNASCKRISLACRGMLEFPSDLNYQNLLILKLMHGDTSLEFPPNFYEEMEKLQVISYDRMKHPLLPSSFECSFSLRVLHLHKCSLMPDCSSIGNLLNLEVLSFAYSGIKFLPSTIGNLKKLRLLDLTDCDGLRIDNGVLKYMAKLEELYARILGQDKGWNILKRFQDQHRKAISFTDDNYNEMAEHWKNLSVLEFEFLNNNTQPKNLSFDNLERFKISFGRYLRGNFDDSRYSFRNTLKLLTKKGKLLEFRFHELFRKTEVLYLSVDDMNDLQDVGVKSSASCPPHEPCSFYNLRFLHVSECTQLKYLFTLGVAKALSNLERLEVREYRTMEALIHTERRGEETIRFPKLKFLFLHGLPKLSSFCHNVSRTELPQLMELHLTRIPNITSIYPENNLTTSCLMKEEVVTPKLMILDINEMDNLKEIWPCEFSTGEGLMLKMIKVTSCHNLVNMFPSNPMPLLCHLEDLYVKNCGSIEALFTINLDFVGENVSSLKNIQVLSSGNLIEVWRMKGGANSFGLPVCGFQAVERITIANCTNFRNVFTPTTTNFDLIRAHINIR